MSKNITSSLSGSNSMRAIMKMARFELLGAIGRACFNRPPPALKGGERLLHLGCGDVILEGWVNADYYSVTPWARRKARKLGINWMLDFRYPFNCPDNYWDGVVSEHTLEHLTPAESAFFLAELYRTLKPGCWLRLATPDLKKYVDYYRGADSPEEFKRWPAAIKALRALTQEWGHRSVWDAEFLVDELRRAGFGDARVIRADEGVDPRLIRFNAKRCWESCYVEARKQGAQGG